MKLGFTIAFFLIAICLFVAVRLRKINSDSLQNTANICAITSTLLAALVILVPVNNVGTESHPFFVSDNPIRVEKSIALTEKPNLVNEMVDKNLIAKLCNAESYIYATPENYLTAALELYEEIVENLSVHALQELDQHSLRQAENNRVHGHLEDALFVYKEVFADAIPEKNICKRKETRYEKP